VTDHSSISNNCTVPLQENYSEALPSPGRLNKQSEKRTQEIKSRERGEAHFRVRGPLPRKHGSASGGTGKWDKKTMLR